MNQGSCSSPWNLFDFPLQGGFPAPLTKTGKGADIVGIADLGLLKGIPTKPGNLLEGFTLAVSVEFKNIPGVGYPICGVCMAVCPWGKGKK